MTKPLQKLTLKNGKFFNQSGIVVKAQIVSLGIATKDGKPLFENHRIPSKANAFAQGSLFDENAGAWSNFPRYVGPTIYLRVKQV